jgi:Transcriptional regulatory protein, C terminal./Bacterial transcriptional activator domain.
MDYQDTKVHRAAESSECPQIKIYTFGEFRVERRDTAAGHYHLIPYTRLTQRSSALIILKILLCQSQRRISRTALIATIWPEQRSTRAIIHTLDTAASQLRRHILNTAEQSSLLSTQHQGGETTFRLPDQSRLWVDADALLTLARLATQLATQGRDPRTVLSAAYGISQGEFLEDNLHSSWSQLRRQTIDGARRRVLHHLIDIYLHSHQERQAEELLFNYLQEFPTDQDALYRLLELLNAQQRRYEALHIFRYCSTIINEQQQQPTNALCELAARIQQNCKLREAGIYYNARVIYSEMRSNSYDQYDRAASA